MSTLSPAISEYRLAWSGPFSMIGNAEDSLRLLADSEQASAPGIYLWAVPLGTNYLVNYVGIACTSIASRHDDHLRSYLSGQYVIYDPNAFRLGKREPVFSPVEGLRTFLRDLERNTKALVAQLRTCRVFFAPLHADRETLECLESALITAFRRNKQTADFLDNLRLSRTPASIRSCVSEGAECFIGYPEELKF